jgi:soluble lytic murein transglycosylase-like protein
MANVSMFNRPLIDPAQITPLLPKPAKITLKLNIFHNLVLIICFCYLSSLLIRIPELVRSYVEQRREMSFLGTPMQSIQIRAISEQEYIGELTVTEKRELAALVNYVADEIIAPNSRNVEDPRKLAFNIVTESLIADEDPFFVSSVILAESNFNKNAKSHVGALGLMQIMPHTGKYISDMLNIGWEGKEGLSNPEKNIRMGVAYIKYLKANFNNDLHKTLIAYNWGPGNVSKRPEKAPKESLKYSNKIRTLTAKFQEDFKSRREQFLFKSLTI